MKTVTINISHRFWKLRFQQSINRQVAETWDELPRATLERIVDLFYTKNRIHVTKLLCLKALLNIGWIRFYLFLPEFKKLYVLPDGTMDTFINYVTGWLFSGFEITKTPYLRLGKCFGPRDFLDGMTAGEFITADHYFHKYVLDQDPFDLDCLVAVLYRPKGKGDKHDPDSPAFCGDLREVFNENTIESRAKSIRKVKMTARLVVLSYYRSCRHTWEKTFDLVFTKSNEETAKSYGWFEVLKAVSSDDFGTIEMKEKVPIGNIFLSMQIDIRNSKKIRNVK